MIFLNDVINEPQNASSTWLWILGGCVVLCIGAIALLYFHFAKEKGDEDILHRARTEKKFFNVMLVLGMLAIEGALAGQLHLNPK